MCEFTERLDAAGCSSCVVRMRLAQHVTHDVHHDRVARPAHAHASACAVLMRSVRRAACTATCNMRRSTQFVGHGFTPTLPTNYSQVLVCPVPARTRAVPQGSGGQLGTWGLDGNRAFQGLHDAKQILQSLLARNAPCSANAL